MNIVFTYNFFAYDDNATNDDYYQESKHTVHFCCGHKKRKKKNYLEKQKKYSFIKEKLENIFYWKSRKVKQYYVKKGAKLNNSVCLCDNLIVGFFFLEKKKQTKGKGNNFLLLMDGRTGSRKWKLNNFFEKRTKRVENIPTSGRPAVTVCLASF